MSPLHWRAEALRIQRDLKTVDDLLFRVTHVPEHRDMVQSWRAELISELSSTLQRLVQPEEAWVPVAHAGSPRVADSNEAVLAYREKVLAAFRAWDMRPGDNRTWHEVLMAVQP
jgi:hypothetical protein